MKTHLFIICLFIFVFCPAQIGLAQDTANKLTKAVNEGKIELVKKMLESGADANSLSEDGASPLIYASWSEDIKIVRLLVAHGANINLNTERFGSALNAAAKNKNEKTNNELMCFHYT